MTRKTRFGSRERDWLKGDAHRGCVCLYGASEPQPPPSGPQTSTNPQPDLKLVLCSTNTTAEELCAQRDVQGLYLQLHGDLIRYHTHCHFLARLGLISIMILIRLSLWNSRARHRVQGLYLK